MLRRPAYRSWRAVTRWACGGIAFALITVVCFQLHAPLETAAVLYLIALVLLSLQGSFLMSAVFSVCAAGSLMYWFASPVFSLKVSDPLSALLIAAFLMISGVITYLATRVRNSLEQQRQLTEQLQRREAHLAEAQRLSRTGSLGWRIGTGEIFWSEETFRIFGYDRAETPTLERMLERVHAEDAAAVRRTIESAAREGRDFAHEYRLVMPDGAVKHIHVVARRACKDDSGGVEFVGAVRDITAEQQARAALERAVEEIGNSQKKLQQSEAYLAQGQALSKTGTWVLNISADVLFVSAELSRILGREPRAEHQDAAIWRGRMSEIIHPEDLPSVEAALAKARNEQAEFGHRIVLADGTIKHVAGVIHPVFDESGKPIELIGTIIDVTERKRSEARLRESEQQWRDVFENNPTMYFMIDAAATVKAVNPFGAEQLGYSVGELIGQPILDVFHDADRDAVRQSIAHCLERLGEAHSWEARKVGKDGRVLCVRETAKAVPRTNGPIILIACEDITERRQIEGEKERLEVQLRQSQKMEAMGTLAGGIAHDFNNILGAILGYGEIAQQLAAEGSVIRHYLDQVMHAGGRAKSLVGRILAFSRSGLGERVPVHVQSVVEETLGLLEASLPQRVRLDTTLDADDAAVIGDATQIHQVVMNLCTNAMQAMEHDGGVLHICVDRVEVIQSNRLLSHGTLGPGRYLRLAVSDTGCGIPPAVLRRMFDPFFSTKRVGEGTGLGLSLVHAIVTDLGGAIDVATSVGAGTTFAIWLPIVGDVDRPRVEAQRLLPRGNGEVVMIIDDERPLVRLAEEALAGLGYEPAGFDSSVDALQAFREDPLRFDLVLTDETMPELTGTDVASEIRQLRPDIPIVLMSGYSSAAVVERARSIGVNEILRKPLVTRDIAEPLARAFAPKRAH